jgi:predicted amidophosphoribosyltransferase
VAVAGDGGRTDGKVAVSKMTPEDMEFLAGFIVFLIILIIAIYLILQARAKKMAVRPGTGEVQCPNCSNFVPHDARSCRHCGSEFEKDGFECPECHETLHYGVKRCKGCGHSFEERKEFVCPKCGEPVDKDAKKCTKCNEEFWAPVRPPSKD